jgi:hypothetical protein
MSDVTRALVLLKLKDNPEESVRQELLQKMELLGYPRSLIIVEKEISSLPHIQGKAPHRRFDIVCLAQGLHKEHPFYPLLLVECKADQMNRHTVSQVVGYNRFVKAIFIGLAMRGEFYLGRYQLEKNTYLFSPGLPPFQELYEEALCSFTNT